METTDYSETLRPVCQTKQHGVTGAEESNVLSLSVSVSTFFLPPLHFRSVCILKSTPSFCTNGNNARNGKRTFTECDIVELYEALWSHSHALTYKNFNLDVSQQPQAILGNSKTGKSFQTVITLHFSAVAGLRLKHEPAQLISCPDTRLYGANTRERWEA
jgi:hypothetical protein